MGAKFSVLFLQFTGISQSAQLLGWGHTMAGIRQVYGHASLKEIKQIVDDMYQKSPQLAARNKVPNDRDVQAMYKGRDPLFKSWFEKHKLALFKLIGATDQMVANAVWAGAYDKALGEGKTEAQAIADADAIISLTQGMGENKDMSYAQQGWAWGDVGKLFTMFGTFYSSTENLRWLATRQALREGRQGHYAKAAAGLFRANWNLAIIPAIFSTLMWHGFDWPDDEEEWDDLALGFARDVVGNTVGGLPIIKDVVGMAMDATLGTGQPRFALSPIEGSIVGGGRAVNAVKRLAMDEGDTTKNVTQLIRAAGPFVPGVPSSQIATTIEGAANWDDNDGLQKLWRLLVRDPEGK